jgi:hypothetical protein
MRELILLVLVILGLAVFDWIRFDRQLGRSSIHLETQTIEDDTRSVLDQGRDVLRDAGDAVSYESSEDASPSLRETLPPRGEVKRRETPESMDLLRVNAKGGPET